MDEVSRYLEDQANWYRLKAHSVKSMFVQIPYKLSVNIIIDPTFPTSICQLAREKVVIMASHHVPPPNVMISLSPPIMALLPSPPPKFKLDGALQSRHISFAIPVSSSKHPTFNSSIIHGYTYV